MIADARDGKPLWHFPTNGETKASPITYTVDGKQFIALAVGPNEACYIPLAHNKPGSGDGLFGGGLDPDATIEHIQAGLVEQELAGKPIRQTSSQELADYCRRYNVGWAVCWSPAAVARFRAWEGAREVAALHDGVPQAWDRNDRNPYQR